jgi:hypothetical protein
LFAIYTGIGLMSVTLIIFGNDTEIPPHIAQSIKSISSRGGPGAFYGIKINGVTFRRELTFKKYASIVPSVGISIDGKMVKKLTDSDEWYVGQVCAVQTVYMYDYDEARQACKNEKMHLY